ncbi:hypothetical protein C8R14_10118 [Nitrosomonas eutropha]|uniref:Uncharacterized protein n=1 Tax=Nitrosomonas eutropha TaxID=916 RepID=A0ABX5MDC1_9PROT|nr:hypothetical protein C8R14_10118 [Nitrosomonas eutropha]
MKHGLKTERPDETKQTKNNHSSNGHTSVKPSAEGHHAMQPNVTHTQLAAVTMATDLMPLRGMTFPALFVNMRLSARDVGGAIMSPGMIMGWDTPVAPLSIQLTGKRS